MQLSLVGVSTVVRAISSSYNDMQSTSNPPLPLTLVDKQEGNGPIDQQATKGISDYQFLQNVVDSILFLPAAEQVYTLALFRLSQRTHFLVHIGNIGFLLQV